MELAFLDKFAQRQYPKCCLTVFSCHIDRDTRSETLWAPDLFLPGRVILVYT